MITEGMIRTIAIALAKTGYRYYFVGGAASVFYIDDKNASRVRPTNDIDCVIEVSTNSEFIAFEKKIKQLGFSRINDEQNICRYQYHDIRVDIIPLKSQQILGFENTWYEKGIKNALSRKMGDVTVKYFPLHYYIASKLEALNNRGINDLMGSRDFEDIIIILDGLDNFDVIKDFPDDVKSYMTEIFSQLVKNTNFIDAVIGHIDMSPVREERAGRIIHFLEGFVHSK